MKIKRFRHIYESSIDDELVDIANIVLDHDDISAKIWYNNNDLGIKDDVLFSEVMCKPGKVACLYMYDLPVYIDNTVVMDIIINVIERMQQIVDVSIKVNGSRYVSIEQLRNYDKPMSVTAFIMPRAGEFFWGSRTGIGDNNGYANYYLDRIVLWTDKPFNTRNGPMARLDKNKQITKLSFSDKRSYEVGHQPLGGSLTDDMYINKLVTSIEYQTVDLSFKYKYIIELQ